MLCQCRCRSASLRWLCRTATRAKRPAEPADRLRRQADLGHQHDRLAAARHDLLRSPPGRPRSCRCRSRRGSENGANPPVRIAGTSRSSAPVCSAVNARAHQCVAGGLLFGPPPSAGRPGEATGRARQLGDRPAFCAARCDQPLLSQARGSGRSCTWPSGRRRRRQTARPPRQRISRTAGLLGRQRPLEDLSPASRLESPRARPGTSRPASPRAS